MRSGQVLELLGLLDAIGVVVWLDGGWAVDALIGRQTRPHDDLDLVVDERALQRVTAVLEAAGFARLRDGLPAAVAWRNTTDGREVDLHPVTLTPDGGGDQAQPDGTRWHYGPPVVGLVDGRPVLTCSLETQLRAHRGYPPRDKDCADMRALADHFGYEPPENPRALRVCGQTKRKSS